MDLSVKLKNKRGIPFPFHIIFSAISVLAQVVFLIILGVYLSEHSLLVYTFSEVAAIITAICIINRRGNPSYKIPWLVFILVFPIFGIMMFLLSGGGRVTPYLKNRMQKCEDKYIGSLERSDDIQSTMRYADYLHSRQADYLVGESGYPLYKNTSVDFVAPGEAFLPRFIEELQKAKKYIYIEFFIVAEGIMWDSICAVLEQKVREGVEVKLLFDDFGSIKRQRKDFIWKLRKTGIEVAAFNKIRPSVDLFMNNRNHRKIVVIDGKTAITGGLNLADEYINQLERFGYWMDCAVILKGDAVKSLLAMFCSTWEFTTGKAIDIKSHISEEFSIAEGFVLPYGDGPLDDKNPAEGIYMQILSTAQKYVYITSPYLIIDNAMINALKMAAKSGIDVRIITPAVPDKWYVHPVTQYNYLELLEAGVRIYEYTPGFIHSKIFVSDDSVATVGTVNMDYRSFNLHFECGVWMASNKTVRNIKEHYRDLLSVSREITIEDWYNTPRLVRLKRAILHVFAPFM